MANVEQIVRQIIEDLSESVHGLVLMVVVLAEQNAPLSEKLSEETEAVNQTAEKLAKIARQLAATDYEKFPSIAKEVRDAADSVDSAIATLKNAISSLRGTSDRKKGWENLTDSCGTLSGATIRLLQIVYGAPLKRINLNADRLTEEISNFPKRGWAENQQQTADLLKPLTENALRMEKYLKDRGNASESPNERAQLHKSAEAVKNKAQHVVDAINAGFKNPKHDDLTIPLRDLQDEVFAGKNLANKTGPIFPPGHKTKVAQGYQLPVKMFQDYFLLIYL